MMRNWLGNVVAEPVVKVEEISEPEAVEAEFAGGLEVEVRVVPEGDLGAVLGDVEAVEGAQVGVEGDEVRLELGLEAEPEAGAVDLGIVVEVVLHLVVLDPGVGQSVEPDSRLAGKPGVEADLVVGVEVVVEETGGPESLEAGNVRVSRLDSGFRVDYDQRLGEGRGGNHAFVSSSSHL